jgi:molecular chaperone DnaJ
VRDPYDVLGVSSSATDADIRDAFRKLAREHHPDQNPGDPGAQQRFSELNTAYQILSDAERRARFDRLGDTSRAGSARTGGPDLSGLEDLLRDLFGGFVAPRVEPGDLQAAVEVTFEQAAFGCKKTLRYERRDICQACEGTGRNGGGRCNACGATGIATRTREIEVNVPAGIEDGASQTVRGGGHRVAPERPPGDLELVIRVQPDARFTRQGDDVHSRIEVPFSLCAGGGSVELETVHGSERVDVPAGTAHGDEMRLRGRGIPHRFRGGLGDHYAEVAIQIPRATSERARELVLDYAAEAEREDGLLDKVRAWFSG